MLSLFTIIQNGVEFLPVHVENIRASGLDFKWVFVEGVALAVKDTSWCRDFPLEMCKTHPDGALGSVDGTHEQLMRLASTDPRFVLITNADAWNGKTAMCNAALTQLPRGPLMQVDADEVWTAQQFRDIHDMLDVLHAGRAIRFRCEYWITDRHVIITRGTYGNHHGEWVRSWAWGGEPFAAHEPPTISGYMTLDCFGRKDLVFKHYAYVTPQSVTFKEKYYGYAGAVAAWNNMRMNAIRGYVRDWLPWVKDDARFELSEDCTYRSPLVYH
jgi:hypothetical protein